MEKTTIYLPDDLRWYLKDAAQRTGRSQADLIREALQAQRDAAPRLLPESVGAYASDGSQFPLTRALIRREYGEHLDGEYGHRPADA